MTTRAFCPGQTIILEGYAFENGPLAKYNTIEQPQVFAVMTINETPSGITYVLGTLTDARKDTDGVRRYHKYENGIAVGDSQISVFQDAEVWAGRKFDGLWLSEIADRCESVAAARRCSESLKSPHSTMEEKMGSYRQVTVSRVTPRKDGVDIDLKESPVSLFLSDQALLRFEIDKERIIEGSALLVRGKNGNRDADLWGEDTIMHVVLANTPLNV